MQIIKAAVLVTQLYRERERKKEKGIIKLT